MRDSRTPRLRRLLTELRSVQPDSAWVSKTRAELLEKIGGVEVVQVSFAERARIVVRSIMPLPARSALRGPIAAVLSGLGLIIGGSMASVSAAEQSVPGDLLFPVKLVSEQTRLAFTSDKTEKVRLKGEFVNRRVEEIKKIAQADVPKKPERLKEATEMLRRDLDTVKNQLTDSLGDKPSERVEVARLIDKASTEAVVGLKVAKASLPLEDRPQFAEAEAAAVNTSVKAVNAILDSQTHDEETKKLVTKEELIESISQKVEGVSEHITSATQQLTDAGILSASGTAAFVSTTSLGLAASTSSVADLLSAHASLAEARQLLSEERLSEVGDKLIEASKSASSAERSAESVVQSAGASSSTSATPPAGSSSSTGTTPVTSTTPTSSSTPTTSPPASTTPSTLPTNQKN